MPSFSGFFGEPRRHGRHPPAPQRPISHSPAVKPPTSPTASKKRSIASKAQLRPSARQEAKSANHSSLDRGIRQETAGKSSDRGDVDVFAFMEDEEEGGGHHETEDEHEEDFTGEDHEPATVSSSPMSAHHPSYHYSDLEVNADQQSKRQTWHAGYDQAGSFHSDSGISMGSTSGDADSPILQHKYPSIRRTPRLSPASHEPSIPEHHGLNTSSDVFPVPHLASGTDAWPQWTGASDNPESYYTSIAHEYPPNITTTICQLPVTPPELSPQLPRNRKEQQAKEPSRERHGYSPLVSTVPSNDGATVKPTYRKFETLNNRILLHLQQGISELEAKVEKLDAAVASEEQHSAIAGQVVSGLAEAKYPTHVHQRRAELLGECASKVNMYSE